MFERKRISVAAALAVGGLGAVTTGVMAQDSQRVEITGSSIRRVDAETALPVQIVTKEEIQRSGVNSTEQLLQNISAMSSQGGIVNATGAGNSTYGTSSVSLRGLGEDRTLVLLNGRRLAAFAGGNGAAINVNAIPLAAIERVEILKDGASSTYGSDAMAGVVNFIMKKDYQGIELGATLAAPTRSGGGQSQRADIVAGFGDSSRWNVTLGASFEKEKALFAKSREFAKTGNVPPFLAAAATGQGNIEGGYTPGTGVPGPETGVPQPGFGNSPGTGYGNPLALTNTCANINMYLDATQTTKGAPFCTFDSNAFVGLIPKRELMTLSGNLTFKLTENLSAFGDAIYSRSEVTQQFQPSPLRRSFMQTDAEFNNQGVDPALIIRPANPNYGIASSYLAAMEAANPGLGFGALIGQPLAVTARVFDFGDRTSFDKSTQSRLTGGLRGSFAQQDWEVALTGNDNKLSGTVPDGYFSQVAFARVINDPASDYNPWSLTQSAAFNSALAASGAKYTGATLDARSKSTSLDGLIRGDITQMPAGPLQYAAGAQFRKESFVTSPSPALETGDIAGLGGATPPVDRDRKINSLFGEVNVPIVKGLEGNLSLRGDHYSDVGNATTYKASAKYQPVPMVAFRGSFGTGFRAPTLIDLWQPQTLGTSEQFNDTPSPPGTGQQDLQVNSLTGGNPNLKPEKSKQGSLGFVVQPMQNFSFGMDYFNIKVEDIITLPSAQEVVSRFRAGDPAYAGLVQLNGTGDINFITQTLQNTGSAKVQGIDFDANYRQDFGSAGRLGVYFNGTYMIQFDQTGPSGEVSHKVGTIVDSAGNPVLSSNTSVNDGVVLRWKHYLSGTWSTGPWAFTLAQNYYRGYRDGNDLNNEEHHVPSQALYDFNVEFSGVKNLRLALGVRNLFDKDPPLFIPTSNQFQAGYDITQYDPRGRVVYLTGSYKF